MRHIAHGTFTLVGADLLLFRDNLLEIIQARYALPVIILRGRYDQVSTLIFTSGGDWYVAVGGANPNYAQLQIRGHYFSLLDPTLSLVDQPFYNNIMLNHYQHFNRFRAAGVQAWLDTRTRIVSSPQGTGFFRNHPARGPLDLLSSSSPSSMQSSPGSPLALENGNMSTSGESSLSELSP